MKIMAYGVFDLFHIGHLNLLKRAKDLGDYLEVGVLSDKMASKLKRKPIINQDQRAEIIKELGFVNRVVIVDDYNLIRLANIVVHGDDWGAPSIDKAQEFGKTTVILPSTKGISTTEIIERIKNVK